MYSQVRERYYVLILRKSAMESQTIQICVFPYKTQTFIPGYDYSIMISEIAM